MDESAQGPAGDTAQQAPVRVADLRQAMAQIEQIIARPHQSDALLDDVLGIVLEFFACDRTWLIGPAHSSSAIWQVYAERTVAAFPGRGRDALFSPAAVARFASVVAAGEPRRDDIASGNGISEKARAEHQIRAQLMLAIHPPGALPCILGLQQCCYDRVWTTQDCQRLETVGRRLGPVVVNLQTQRLLVDSERRLAEAERIAHLGYWEIDLDLRAVRTSAEYTRIFGLEGDSLLRDLPSFRRAWSQRLHPDDRQRVKAAVDTALREGCPYALEYRLRMDDDRIRHVRVRGESLDRDETGRPRRWFGTAQDVTELRQAEADLRSSEARFRATVDHAVDAVMLHDGDGRILDVNRAACETLGYAREELIGQSPLLFDHAIGQAGFLKLGVGLQNGQVVTMNTRHRRKDGSEFPVEVRMRQFHHDGRLQGVSVTRDISERQHLEEQLRQAQKMEAVGLLAGGIAHNFNNLLMIILGYGEMALTRMAADDPNRAAVAEMVAGGERAAQLTRQLLAFSRQQVLTPQALCLRECLLSWQEFMHPLVGDDRELVVEIGPETGLVRVDRSQFEQAMTNLVINARDAMPDGGTITVTASDCARPPEMPAVNSGAPEARCALISVRDHGHGIDASHQARVFDPFFTTKPIGRGTGLGLAMVYGFVTQSGGHIAIDSTPGAGTCVRLYLPLCEETDLETSPPVLAGAGGGHEMILLVEDQPAVRRLCVEVLEAAGYGVMPATDGAEALALYRARAGAIDLLIADVIMPHMKGPQLAAALCAAQPGLPVLFMSGHADDDTRATLPPGATLLSKPFQPQDLLRQVRSLLDRQATADHAH